MKKPISTRTHGIIDYGWAALATAFAEQVNGATDTARLLRAAAAAATSSSLVTNYEYGVLRVMPMRGHLALDFALSGALLLSPLFLPQSERRHVWRPVLLGAAGLVTGLLTKTRSPHELGDEFAGLHGGSREVSMVADQTLDAAVSPHLRPHLE